MSQERKLRKLISNAPNEQFWIDEHAFNKLDRHPDLDIGEIVNRLRTNKFKRVEPNDSKLEDFVGKDSFRVVIRKSSNYLYAIVVYETMAKPLIKTVYELDRGAQSKIG